MQSLVGYFIQPLTGLTIDIGKITEAAQRPEVLANIPDAPFHLSFFPTRRGITYPGENLKLVSKGQETWIEANDSAVPLGNYGQHIIVQTFPRGSLHEPEGMKMAANEGSQFLAVGELEIEPPAVTFHAAKGIESPFVTLVVDPPEMPPINLETIPWVRFHPDIRPGRVESSPYGPDVVIQDGSLAGVSQRLYPLSNHGSTGFGILVEQLPDDLPVRIQFASALLPASLSGQRRKQVLLNSLTRQVEMPGDFPHRPLLPMTEPEDSIDLLWVQNHWRKPSLDGSSIAGPNGQDQKHVLYKIRWGASRLP